MSMKIKRKILPLLLTAAMIIGLLPATTALADTAGDFVVTGGVPGIDYAYSDGVLTFSTPGNYTVSMLTPGATTNDRICVNAYASSKITLNGVKIDVSGIPDACAFYIGAPSTVEIVLAGTEGSVLKSGAGQPGIRASAGVNLTISGERSLEVWAGSSLPDMGSGAGIGGGIGENGGVININASSSIDVRGGDLAAGIGGGAGGSGGTVGIYNGTIVVYCGFAGAGIGGGRGGSGGTINIGGGSIYALGTAGGAGIGGGGGFDNTGGNAGNITISGGDIIATGGNGGAGIGGGVGIDSHKGGSTGNIIISGGTITANGSTDGTNGGAGIGGSAFGGCESISISGGEITANSSADGANGGAGIGSGFYGSCQNISITGGKVTALGGVNAAGLGAGKWGTVGNITIGSASGPIIRAYGGEAAPGSEIAGSPFASETAYSHAYRYFHSEEFIPELTVTGGSRGTDYHYTNGLLTITSDAAMTVSMTTPGTTTSDTIAIASDVDANITLSDVSIDASGTSGACALKIADGSSGNVNITLSGNNVLKSGNNCAGLQKNGSDTGVGTLTIRGSGALTAEGGSGGAGIGGGSGGSTRNITISDGSVTAIGGSGGAGIGGGSGGSGDNINIAPLADHRIRVYAGSSAATATELAGSPFTSQTPYTGTYAYFRSVTEPAPGLCVTGGTEGTDYTYTGNVLTIIKDTAMTISMTRPGATTHDVIMVSTGGDANITLNGVSIDTTNGALIIDNSSAGDVHITLTGDNTLKSGGFFAALHKGGIGTLTIDGTGSLTALGGGYAAGIGGSWTSDASNITINGGTVIATGGAGGAGIGGGYPRSGSNITINGGTVIATGGSGGAGIGGGYGSASNITISGGEVSATGGDYGAGIGGGSGGSCSNITISGGEVTATGGKDAPGIGSGGSYDGPPGGPGTNVNIAPAPGTAISVFFGDTTPPTGTPASGNPIVAPNVYAYTGAHKYFHSERQVESVALVSATADGVSGTQTSTRIELVFDKAITGLTAGDITITNGTGSATKGALSGSGTNWAIALTSVAAEGTVSVAVDSPEGYSITGSPKTVEVYKAAPTINPVNGVFDKNPANQADVQTNITWHDATSVADVKAGGVSIGAGSYSVSGNTLTIKKEYLASQPVGNLVLSVEFNEGGTATLTIEISDTTPITGLPATYTMYEGGRVTWDPKPDGGTWDWDHEFFSATFNSPATFTALKAGTSVITYTVNGLSQSITVTIYEAELPVTGQDFTLAIWLLIAGLCVGLFAISGFVALRIRLRRKGRA